MAEDTMMEDQARPLFEDLVFAIIPSGNAKEEEEIKEDLLKHGGQIQDFDSEKGRIEDLDKITHIISSTSDFPDYALYEAARDRFKHVVTPAWVRQSIWKNKLANPRSFNPDPAMFMSGMIICCGYDLPEQDKETIIGLVIAVGGQESPMLQKSVTHLVALNMDDSRCQLADNKNLKCKKVLPHWIDDCFKLGRRLPEGPYTLPDPDILKNVKEVDPKRPKDSQHIRDATTPAPTEIPSPISSPNSKQARSIPAFKGKKIMLADDLHLRPHTKEAIEELITNGGGRMTADIDDADSYVCRYRSGSDYIKASQAKKDVGNLGWLFHLITYNTWTSPMRRMLHYPVPKDGIPGFQDFKISLSNFQGEARVYLENLIKATGAEFTKTFRQENTHLIAASDGGSKCEAAEEWHINVINHLWLEDSYARCTMMSLTDPRYTYFPGRTNLGEILGQTQLDKEAVRRNYYPESEPVPAKANESKKEKKGKAAATRTISDTTDQLATPLAGRHKKRIQSDATFTTPTVERHSSEKENVTPGTSGSRGAKMKAISSLAESATDIALYEKEKKRAGGVVHGGRREKGSADATEKTKKLHSKGSARESTGSKRSFDDMSVDEQSVEEEAEEAPRKSKKSKKEKMPPIQYRMVLSKDDRWANNLKKEAEDKNKLRELGLSIVEKPIKVNMLCAPVIVRTRKFVTALAAAPTLVSTSYLDYALKHHKLPPVEKHPLVDPDFEELHGFRMDESLERARQNKGRLLKNWTIFCTSNVTGGFDTWKEIIEANGGVCQKWEGRQSVRPTHRTVDAPETQDMSQNLTEDDGNTLYLISEPKKTEVALWKKFKDLAATHNMTPRIVKTEWLLFVAMAQYIHYKEEWELNEEKLKAA